MSGANKNRAHSSLNRRGCLRLCIGLPTRLPNLRQRVDSSTTFEGCGKWYFGRGKNRRCRYTARMQIDFDPTKDAANRDKHGISLGDATLLEWDSAVVWPDDRLDYGEDRMCALGYIGLRLYCVAFVDREYEDGEEVTQVRRIISLRKANPREYRKYAST